METSPVKRLVCVNVPNPSQHRLVEKGSLHSPPGTPQEVAELSSSYRGGLWSKTRQKAVKAILN
jgi:hypothetical protein